MYLSLSAECSVYNMFICSVLLRILRRNRSLTCSRVVVVVVFFCLFVALSLSLFECISTRAMFLAHYSRHVHSSRAQQELPVLQFVSKRAKTFFLKTQRAKRVFVLVYAIQFRRNERCMTESAKSVYVDGCSRRFFLFFLFNCKEIILSHTDAVYISLKSHTQIIINTLITFDTRQQFFFGLFLVVKKIISLEQHTTPNNIRFFLFCFVDY